MWENKLSTPPQCSKAMTLGHWTWCKMLENIDRLFLSAAEYELNKMWVPSEKKGGWRGAGGEEEEESEESVLGARMPQSSQL